MSTALTAVSPSRSLAVLKLDPDTLRVALERDLCLQLERDRAFARIREIVPLPDAKTIRRRLMAQALLLTEGMAPDIHAHARSAALALGVDKPIEIYQSSGRENAAMHAVEEPVLLEIQGRLLTLLDGPAAVAVFGHELGHFLAHGPATATGTTGRLAAAIANSEGVELHLQKLCSRLSMAKELTADRFGLVACGDLEALLRLEMIATTGLPASALTWDTKAYLAQAKELIESSLEKGEAALGVTHPEHSLRAYAAWLFSESDVFKSLTGKGPGSRTLAEIDSLLAKILLREDVDADYHFLDDRPRELHECALACAVFVAAADGEISEIESAAIEKVFAPVVPDWRWYLNVENAHQRFSEVGGVVAWSGEEVKRSLFHLLVHVIGVDGVVHEAEVDMVVAIGDALGCGTMYRTLLRPFLKHFGVSDRDLSTVTTSIPLPARAGEARDALRALLKGFARRRGGETTLRRLLRVLGERAKSDSAINTIGEETARAGLVAAPSFVEAEIDAPIVLSVDAEKPAASVPDVKKAVLRDRTPQLETVQKAVARLREKLVSGDGRSPSIRLYGARPGRAFDLHALEQVSVGLSERALARVRASETASLIIAAESGRHEGARKLAAELVDLERESRARFEETGARDLFVGYPFLTGVVDGYLFRAPLVLHPVDLVRDDRGARSFSLTARKDEPPIPNQALIRLLFHKREYALPDELARKLDELAADPAGGPEAILAEIKKLGIEAMKLTGTLIPLKNRDDEFSNWRGNRFEIEECAVLGLFPQSGSDLLQDYDGLLADLAQEGRDVSDLLACAREILPSNVRDAFPAIEETPAPERRVMPLVFADPSQEEVLRRARSTRAIVVDGPPGTGKSQVIVNLVADALGRGERVAVVCEKRAALDVVAQRLDGAGLRHACALVHDVREDRRTVYKQIAMRLEDPRDRTFDEGAANEVEAQLRRVDAALDARGKALAKEVAGTTLTAGALHALVSGIEAPALSGTETIHRVTEAHLPKLLDQICAVRPYLDLLRLGSPFRPSKDARRASLESTGDDAARALEGTFDAAISTAAALEGIPHEGVDLDALGEARKAIAAARASRPEREGAARLFVKVVQQGARDPDDLAKIEEAHALFVEHREAMDRVGSRVAIEPSSEAERALAIAIAWAGRFFRFFVVAWWSARGVVRRHLASAWPERVADPLDRSLLESLRDRIAASKGWRALEACGETFGIKAQIGSNAGTARAWIERLFAVRIVAGEVAKQRRSLTAAKVWPEGVDDDAVDAWEKSLDARANLLAAKDAHESTSAPIAKSFGWVGARPSSASLKPIREAWRLDGLRLIELDRRLASARATFAEVDGVIDALREIDADASVWRDAVTRAWGASHVAVLERAEPAIVALDRPTAHGDETAAAAELASLHERLVDHERNRILARLDGASVLTAAAPLKGRRRNADQAAREQMLKECRKQRSIMPMRSFVRAFATRGLVEVMPAWLLSPETMAVLFPREPIFDLVVFDEASQCTVENGVPVLLRARRVVIAGDEKQMPPTRFFDAQLLDTPEESTNATEEEETLDAESLLTLARARIEHVGLGWHYRCREEELIAFSNHAMYGGNLLTIPSTATLNAQPALRWIAVENGEYESGRNPREAERVVDLLRDLLLREKPPSLGVVTFNIQQRRVILDEIDRRRASDADFGKRWDAAVANEKIDERPFVKNLENVQGDERDVIVFSLGHAPIERAKTKERYVPSRFGPLGQAGGERRLNVAISRAKELCFVVASFAPEMLSVGGTLHDGPKLFKEFLEFAHHLGGQRRTQAARVLDRVREDQGRPIVRRTTRAIDYVPLSVQVAEALRQRGLTVEMNVGTSDFRVPVAVIDSKNPDRYRLAVICDDGADSGGAFDRFVHRPRALAARGWRVVRVSAREWWKSPTAALDRIVAAL